MSERLTGNQLWRLRTKHGRDKLFGDAALLLEEAYKYFDWCDRHPWEKVELVKYKGGYEEAHVPLGRPYTMDGLTIYLGVSGSYFRTAKRQLLEKMEAGRATTDEIELIGAIERIEHIVRSQQIEGAALGIFSPGLVARLNGIADKQDITSKGATVMKVTVRDSKTDDDLEVLKSLL